MASRDEFDPLPEQECVRLSLLRLKRVAAGGHRHLPLSGEALLEWKARADLGDVLRPVRFPFL